MQRCLELDPTSVHAHLLKSQIYLAQGNFAMCSHCLELGVSHNFQVGGPLRPVTCSAPPNPSWLRSPQALGEKPRELPASSDPPLARRRGGGGHGGQAQWALGALSSSGDGAPPSAGLF